MYKHIQIKIERQTDRQSDRQTDREIHLYIYRHFTHIQDKDRETDR